MINRTPNSTIEFKLPEEVWSGRKPDIGHLKRFGCTAYVHVTQDKTSPRALKGMFVGYPFGVKGYHVWITEDAKCVTSRNVIFREEEVYKDVEETTKKAEPETELRKEKR